MIRKRNNNGDLDWCENITGDKSLYLYREDPYYEIPGSFWVNAGNVGIEFKKIIVSSHFKENLISFKILLRKI